MFFAYIVSYNACNILFNSVYYLSYRISSVEVNPIKLDKKKVRSSMDLITQTLKENKERADQKALGTKLITDR